MIADELKRFGGLEDEAKAAAWAELPEAKRTELIEYNDEWVREWRGVCQLCGAHLRGTRRSLKEHKCDSAG